MRSRYRQSINPWPFAIVNKKGNPGLNVTFWVVIYSDSEFIAWVWTQLSYFEYKCPQKRTYARATSRLMKDTWAFYKKKKKPTTTSGSWRSLYVNDNVECLGSWIFSNIGWLSTFHCLLVECYHIWSRFVNETHEYLINSFIDHGGLTVYAFAQRKFY